MTNTFRLTLLFSILAYIGCNKNQKVSTVLNDSLSVEETHRSEIIRKDSNSLTYKHKALGISFNFGQWDYTPPKLVQPTSDWVLYTDQENKISFLLPHNLKLLKRLRESLYDKDIDSTIVIDFGGGAGVNIYKSSLAKDSIFYEWGFEQTQIDSDGSFIYDLDDDSMVGIDTVWTSSGRQGMLVKATALDGIEWYGLRSVNYTGIFYTEAYTRENGMSGYAGLAEFLQIVLVHKNKYNGTKLVAVYYEYPQNVMTDEESSRILPQLYGEEAFYEILATLKSQ